MKNFLFILFYLLVVSAAMAQAPSKFRYQAVARDQSGVVINGNINLRITFLEDGPNGQQRYTETHNVNTNTQGVFDLTIGAGTSVLGDIDDVTWKSHDYWLKVEMKTSGASNFTEMGKTQLLSVPYAKYAEQSGSSFTAGPGIAINNGVVSNTGDLSPNNELQTLAINGNLLSISNGNVITLPTGTTYTEGSGIDINGNVISANDASPTNEIQTLSLNGQQLSLSNGGGSVTLPAGSGGSNSLWSLSGNVLSNNPTTNSVAIGTTSSGSPAAKLNVSASGSDIAGKFYSSGGAAAVYAYSNGASAAVSGSSLSGRGGDFSSNSGPGGYFSSSSGPALLTGTGNVGIGVTNPTRKLEVSGLSYFSNVGGLALQTGSGNVGIGVSSTVHKLEVNGSVSTGALEVEGASNSGSEALSVTNNGSGAAATLYSTGGPGLKVIQTSSYATNGIEIHHGGDHWTTHMNFGDGYSFSFNGTTMAQIWKEDGSYHNSSDSRLKKHIQPFSNVLPRLTQLQAYTYRMKTAADDAPISVGFMAQEVEAQFPQLVVENEGYKTLCYDHFAVLSVQAIKEQQVQIEDLQKQVEALKQMVLELAKN